MANNKLITPDFKLHHVRQFIESITEPANTIYYVFGGKPTEYTLGDQAIDVPNTDIESLSTRIYDEMTFAKSITSNDVKPMVARHNWTTGTAYAMYDSLDKTLQNKNFFVVSPEGGTYYVFKCLYNKNGANSTSQPLFSATSADDSYYETADGYIWKYMYQIDTTTFNKFATNDYIPVIPDSNVSSNAVNGGIDVVKIVSEGRKYNNFLTGQFSSDDIKFGGNPLTYRITSPNATTTTNFYEGCIIKITSNPGLGQYRTITGSAISEGYFVITVDKQFITDPTTSNYEIMPRVEIVGDGRQTINAEARALVNTSASNSIYRIEMLNPGEGYFLADASVYANPVSRTNENNAQLRVIYSPRGGHGYDAESELFATRLGISVKFSNNENDEISTDNDFRTIGILKDPKFHNVKLNYDSLDGSFQDTEEIIQAKLNRINGTVLVSTTSKNVISIGTLNGIVVSSSGNLTYSNTTDLITVSNVVINASANLSTNSTGYIQTISLLSAGYGISDSSSPVIFASNTDNGNVRHFNSRIIAGSTFSANGRAYSNNDYIEVSGTGVSVNAIVSLTTNSIGGILTTTITNRGKGFACNEIAYVKIDNGGFGYQNGSVAFSGGGATSTATAITDSLGNVTSIVFTSKGQGYTSPPTVTPPGTPSLVGTFTAILQANGISVKISNSSGGYSNGAKVINAYFNETDLLLTTGTSLDLDFTSSSYSIWEDSASPTGDEGLYANSDNIIFVSPSNSQGNAVANVITYENGSLRTVNVNSGNNFGFNLSNPNIEYFAANSSGGFKRRFDSKIVSSAPISNSAPSYRIKNIIITAGGGNYDASKLLRVDIADGGIGYNSTANNILVFNGSGFGANATYSNDSTGKITSITMVANGNGYGNTVLFSGNSSNVVSADDFIRITPSRLANGQAVYYYSGSSQPTIGGLTNNQIYYIVDANTTGVKLSDKINGTAINLTATTDDTTQYLRSVTTISINAQANGIGANLIPVLANSITITSSDNGHGAVAFFTNGTGGAGTISYVTLANAGFGYTTPPTATISDPVGSGATFRVELEGVATNFANNDQIVFYGGTANGAANVIANGQISNIFGMYYTGRSRYLGTRELSPSGIFFKSDGTRYFSIGNTADIISQYDLSTAWDVTTSTHSGNTVAGVLRQTSPNDLYISATGTSVYVASANATGTGNGILQFSLSQAWNVQTMSYVANVTTIAREPVPTGVWFKSDGTRAYIIGSTADRIQQYDLSSAWDITTATYNANVNPNISGGPSNPTYQSVSLDSTGTTVYVLESGRSILYAFNLTQAWNVESIVTTSYANLNFEPFETVPTAVYLNNSLGKLWMTGSSTGDSIFEYQANPTYTTNITDSGGGFTSASLKILVANSSGGNTRYLNANIIQNIVVANSVYDGFAVNTDVIYVTNGNINAVGNAVTNSTGGLTHVNLTVSGAGFVNASSLNMFTVNSTGGDVRYFNTNVVSSIGISDGGTGYSNTDYIIVSSPVGEPAYANIETTTNGTIVSTKLSNRGRGIVPWYVSSIEIIDGGAGYSNSDVIKFCGGGGTGANAVLLTNSIGGIVRTYILKGGENYDCAPEVEIANSTGGTSTGTSANLVSKITKLSTLRIYDANGNPSIGTFADLSLTVKASPRLVANLIYAPTISSTLSRPASVTVELADSANLSFTSLQAANLSLLISDQRTTFDSAMASGDYIHLQTTTQSEIKVVDEVVNSTVVTLKDFPSFTNDAVAISVAKINAKGNVVDQGSGYVEVTNAYGFFVQSNDIIGVSSRSSANVTSVSYNGVAKTGTNIDQLFTYKVSSGNPTLFKEDTVLTGGIDDQSTAYFHSANSTVLRVVRPSGLFYSGNTITGTHENGTTTHSVILQSGSTYKYEGDFVRGSGEIIYVENIEPISRSNTQSEIIKLILEF